MLNKTTMTREELLEVYEGLIDENTELLLADGFDDAIIGLCILINKTFVYF